MKPLRVSCGEIFSAKRRKLGYQLCLDCGDQVARARKFTVLTPHKQGAMFFTAEFAREAAKGINNKGGLTK
jgi:hypothetical protein